MIGSTRCGASKPPLAAATSDATTGNSQTAVIWSMLFIIPFFLFSALAGQLGEKYPKDQLIRLIKLGEIAIMGVGAINRWR